MVSEPTRRLVWQQMLDVARFHRYYDQMASRYQHYYGWSRVVLALATLIGGGTVSMASHAIFGYALLEPIEAVFAVGVAFLLALDLQAEFARRTAVLNSVQRECADLDETLAVLWTEIQAGRLTEDEVLRRYTMLAGQLSRAHERISGVQVSTDKKLNERCEAVANKVIEERYAS